MIDRSSVALQPNMVGTKPARFACSACVVSVGTEMTKRVSLGCNHRGADSSPTTPTRGGCAYASFARPAALPCRPHDFSRLYCFPRRCLRTAPGSVTRLPTLVPHTAGRTPPTNQVSDPKCAGQTPPTNQLSGTGCPLYRRRHSGCRHSAPRASRRQLLLGLGGAFLRVNSLCSVLLSLLP